MHPGLNVVCVNNKPLPDCSNCHINLLIVGAVYTVRDVLDHGEYHRLGIRLEEIRLPINVIQGREWSYDVSRFKPCKLTSLSVFDEMLNHLPQKIKIREDV